MAFCLVSMTAGIRSPFLGAETFHKDIYRLKGWSSHHVVRCLLSMSVCESECVSECVCASVCVLGEGVTVG